MARRLTSNNYQADIISSQYAVEYRSMSLEILLLAGEYKNMKVKPISEIIGAHRDNVKVALDAVQSKLKPLNQSIAILKDEEHEMKVGNFSATV